MFGWHSYPLARWCDSKSEWRFKDRYDRFNKIRGFLVNWQNLTLDSPDLPQIAYQMALIEVQLPPVFLGCASGKFPHICRPNHSCTWVTTFVSLYLSSSVTTYILLFNSVWSNVFTLINHKSSVWIRYSATQKLPNTMPLTRIASVGLSLDPLLTETGMAEINGYICVHSLWSRIAPCRYSTLSLFLVSKFHKDLFVEPVRNFRIQSGLVIFVTYWPLCNNIAEITKWNIYRGKETWRIWWNKIWEQVRMTERVKERSQVLGRAGLD